MSRERILVPLGTKSRDLKAVYHALALAKRVKARVLIVFLQQADADKTVRTAIEQACLEAIQGIRENGMAISYHIITENYEAELLKKIEHQHIDLIVISKSETQLEQMIMRILPQVNCQVIQVKGKDDINFLH